MVQTFAYMVKQDTNQRAIMGQHIAACKGSGQTVAAYCNDHHLKAHQYYYWQKKLQLLQPMGKFININPQLSNAIVNITFINGNRISFEAMPPFDYIKQLIGG